MLPTLRFGKYTISGLLGPGGLTETYLAHLPEDADRVYALKLLRPDRFSPERLAEARERFRSAGKRLQGLLRPGIGRITDFSPDDTATFLVTEFVVGGDLRYLLDLAKAEGTAERPGMDPIFAGLLGAELARVLHLAHQAKPSLPHLGLSLGNVVVGREGDLVLCDLGLAASLRGLAEEPLERWSHVAPELHGRDLVRHPVSEREGVAADLYGLGSLIFQLLAGDPPAAGETAEALLAGKRDPRVDRPGIPARLQSALRAMLSPDWEERPPTALAVVDWLANDVPSPGERRRLIAKGISLLEKGTPAISREIPLQEDLVALAPAPPTPVPAPPAPVPAPPAAGKVASQPIPKVAAPRPKRRWWPLWLLLPVVLGGVFLGTRGAWAPPVPAAAPPPPVGTRPKVVDPETAPTAAPAPAAKPTLAQPPEPVVKLPRVEGHLVVDTDPPGATVWVDGVEKGKTFADITLGAGGHRIVVIAPGHRMFREVVDATAGVIIRRALMPIPPPTKGEGLLSVECDTMGKFPILINDEETGLLCPAKAIPLPAGQHTVGLYLPPSRKTTSVNVQVVAGARPAVARFTE